MSLLLTLVIAAVIFLLGAIVAIGARPRGGRAASAGRWPRHYQRYWRVRQ